MKFATVSAVAVTALLQAVNADFTLYRMGIGSSGIGGNSEGWQAYPGELDNCDDAIDWIWRDSDDVSGGKYGVRCEGDGCVRNDDSDPSLIDIAEMNFNSDEFHWTYYKERDGALVDLGDNQIGTCTPKEGGIKATCGLDPIGQVVGLAKLECKSDYTADDINGNRPSKRRAARDFRA